MKRNNVKLLNVASLWWLGSDFRWLPQYAFIRPTFDQNIDIMSFISILFFRKNVNYKHYVIVHFKHVLLFWPKQRFVTRSLKREILSNVVCLIYTDT